jgi:HlyD family secretion protein
MTRKRIIIVGAIVAGVAAIVLANLKLSYEEAVGVEVARVEKGPIVEKVSGPGVVYAEASVEISSSVMGRITDLAVKEGQGIHRGDVLVRIDDSQYRARVDQADAAHRGALARIDLAAARLADAEQDAARVSALAGSGLVSDRELQAAKTALAVAQADLASAREASGEARAALLAARDDLDKTTIPSPISGTVTSLNVEQGEIAITGTMNNAGTVLMTVSNLDTMEVRANIDETDVAKVRPGQAVEISVDAFADTVLSGVVSVVGSSSSSARAYSVSSDQRATFEVRVRILDRISGLRPGMATTVDIVTAASDSAAFVPMQALVAREAGAGAARKETEGIFTVEKSRAKFVALRTGISDDKNIEILGDLAPGEEVIVGPFKVLRDLVDSTRVKVSEVKTAKARE